MNKLSILGAIIFIIGVIDIGGSFVGFDLWAAIGIQLPDILWKFSAYIELGIGSVLFSIGNGDSE